MADKFKKWDTIIYSGSGREAIVDSVNWDDIYIKRKIGKNEMWRRIKASEASKPKK